MKPYLIILSLCAYVFASLPAVHADEIGKPKISIELLSSTKGVVAGHPMDIGLHILIPKGWHIYAAEPGDFGRPTIVQWKLAPGFRAGPLQWLPSEKFLTDGFTSYGFENETIIKSEITPPAPLNNNSEIAVGAHVEYALCNDRCIPGKLDVSLTLPVSNTVDASSPVVGALFARFSKTPTTGRFEIVLLFCSAFLGGLLLNLMPCVFPVLSLKVMGFLGQARSASVVGLGLMYSCGCILSFCALYALLLVIRGYGTQAGWGYQFQSPTFVALSGLVVFAVGLNLLGVFELGQNVQLIAGRVQERDGYLGSLLSGALATLLATPCSAPFMASAITAALSMPAALGFLIVATLGLGMCSPFLLLSLFPGWLKFLPAPGQWMTRLKSILAFPMFGTAIWLCWVLSLQAGLSSLIQFLTAILLLSIGLWVLGQWNIPLASRRVRLTASGFASGLIVLAVCFALPESEHAKLAQAEVTLFEPFSEARLADHLTAQQPVLVEFSAAWCLTCQFNHKLIFGSSDVQEMIKTKKVQVMIADWTKGNSEITSALAKFGRDSVPLSVLYYPGNTIPRIFPTILTVNEVKNALLEIPNNL